MTKKKELTIAEKYGEAYVVSWERWKRNQLKTDEVKI